MISEYFTDDDLEQGIRQHLDYDEMWDMDLRTIFNQIKDRGVDFYLEFRGHKFSIDKLTGQVTDLTENG